MSLLELFCDVDGSWQDFQPHWEHEKLQNGALHRLRPGQLSVSEVMTIMIHFHQSHYRHFKAYYTEYVQMRLRSEFPQLVGYGRFVQLMPRVLVPLCAYLVSCYGHCTGVSFIGSTPIAVCHNRRIPSHRVFAGSAARGKSSVGWFFGFKLHLVVNDLGELLACRLTPGNIDDRPPVPSLAQRVFGKLFGALWGPRLHLSPAVCQTLCAGSSVSHPTQEKHEEPIDAPWRQGIIAQRGCGGVEGHGSESAIQARINQIKTQIEDTTSEYDREKLQERMAKLSGGVAVIKVGAAMEIELKERKARVEDALSATRSAVEEGIVPGGGVALVRAQRVLSSVPGLSEDETVGISIIRRALEQPLKLIVENAGYEGAVVLNQVKQQADDYGYDADVDECGPMLERGIVDPTKVTRSALQNAASAAAMVLTTESMITEIPEEKPAAPPMPPMDY